MTTQIHRKTLPGAKPIAVKIREIFEKQYLQDTYLGQNETVFLFETYRQPLYKQPGTKDFMSALKEVRQVRC